MNFCWMLDFLTKLKRMINNLNFPQHNCAFYPPSISTINASNKGGHWLIGTSRLHLVILASALLTTAALELVSFSRIILGHLGI